MKALITGASTGIGRDIAKILHSMNIDLFLVARNQEKLNVLKQELNDAPNIISMDLSDAENCLKLYKLLENENIDILINNAGFGTFGYFEEIPIDAELNMIDLNIKAVHILTKLFLADFKKRNSGYILNVASSAAFLPGPLMATYYSTKAYVLRLTTAINEELRKKKRDIYVGALCPGPVNTEFNKTAGVTFALNGLESSAVAHYAVKKMFKRKMIIVPGLKIKLGLFLSKFLPQGLLLKISFAIQSGKGQK